MKRYTHLAVWFTTASVAFCTTNELFDDFSYEAISDPAFGQMGWHARSGSGGPGSPEASWSETQVRFVADPDSASNRLIQMSATTAGSAKTSVQSEINQQPKRFLGGTYAARVRFTDTPSACSDLTVQAFFTINTDPPYSECDFEYLAYDHENWYGAGLYETTWGNYIDDGRRMADQPREISYQLEPLADWHVLVLQVGDNRVRYFIDDRPVAEHSLAVVPDCPMTISLQHWFGILLGGSTNERTHVMDVDWVYHAKDQWLSTADVTSRIRQLRTESIERLPCK